MENAPLAVLFPVLIAVGYCDLRYMRIPNTLSILAVAIFVLSVVVLPPPDLPARLITSGLVFAVGFLGFCFRILGGGDVKILAALLLFVPVSSLLIFANVLSVSLLLGVSLIVGLRRLPTAAESNCKAISTTSGFPMGISIAAAGVLHPLVMTILGT